MGIVCDKDKECRVLVIFKLRPRPLEVLSRSLTHSSRSLRCQDHILLETSSRSPTGVGMDRALTTMIPIPSSTGLRKLGAMGNPSKTMRTTLVSASANHISKSAAQIDSGRARSKPREEIYAPGYLTDEKVRYQIMWALNPDIDTTPAVLGNKDPGKIRIKLYHPPFGTAGKPLSLTYSEVNWDSPSEIQSLNRWRRTTFTHYLGPGFQNSHDLEKESTPEGSEVLENRAPTRKSKRTMARVPGGADSWAKVTEAFNMRFSNHELSCRDETKPESISQDCGRHRTSIPSPVSQSHSRRPSTSSLISERRVRALTKARSSSSGIPKPVSSR